jgi:hypothetical protein
MSNRTFKVALCLVLIAIVIASLGCAGRGRVDDPGKAATATPNPAKATQTPGPTATPQAGKATPTTAPAPTAAATPAPQPVKYTTNLSLDDVFVSGGDMQDSYAEDALPTPPAGE